MARQDNGIVDLSLLISDIEKALYDYAHTPLRGLQTLHLALLSFQKNTQICLFDSLYHQRLGSLIAATEQLLLSGSPYVERYHKAFLSSADALAQIAIACQFSEGRAESLQYLLLADRSCWQDVLLVLNEETVFPNQVNYLARFSMRQSESVSVDVYLAALACAGRVSFDLEAINDKTVKGQFRLTTAQSLPWLETKFPELQWQEVSADAVLPLRALCEFSFLPIFQNTSMQRDARYRLLEQYEKAFKQAFYQPFSQFFPPDDSAIEWPNRLVPIANVATSFEINEGVKYFPLRHGGAFFVGSSVLGQEVPSVAYLSRLGHDFLAYFLYEVDTGFGRFVFDRAECLGTYAVIDQNLSIDGEWSLFHVAADIQAKLVLTTSLFSTVDAAFSLLPQYVDQVLVVRQGGQYFALPYSAIREVEGVCSIMSTPRAWVKNVWLSRDNGVLIEPWLFHFDSLPAVSGQHEVNTRMCSYKNGYYFGFLCGRMFWIEAALVFALLPYQSPFSVVYRDDETFSSKSFIIHDGRCFDRVLPKDFASDVSAALGQKKGFSMILEGMGESVVLPFVSCDWCASLPDARYVREFTMFQELFGHSDGKRHLMSSQGDGVVIDKQNFLSFIAGFQPLYH
jgi:hypothetical protein